MFLDMTIHDFDMVRFLSGSEVEEVQAFGAVLVDPAIGEAGDIDTAIGHLNALQHVGVVAEHEIDTRPRQSATQLP